MRGQHQLVGGAPKWRDTGGGGDPSRSGSFPGGDIGAAADGVHGGLLSTRERVRSYTAMWFEERVHGGVAHQRNWTVTARYRCGGALVDERHHRRVGKLP
jgi:hypothetical protein